MDKEKLCTEMVFSRKPLDTHDLKETQKHFTNAEPFRVVKIIELTGEAFEDFSENLHRDDPIIARNNGLMYYDEENKYYRCLLFTTRKREEGILVNAEGFEYARYAAYVENCRKLNLRNVPVERRLPARNGHER